MKLQLITSLLFLLLFPFRGQAEERNDLPDSVFTKTYLIKHSVSDPARVHAILDVAEEQHRMPQYLIDDLRGRAYHNQGWFTMATIYTRKALASDSVKAKPKYELELRQYECTNLVGDGQFVDAIRIATENIEKAKAMDDIQMESAFLFSLGQAYINVSLKEEGIECFKRVIDLFKNTSNVRNMAFLSTTYGEYMACLIEMEHYDKAVEIGLMREELINKMSTMPGPPNGYIDQQYGFLYCKIAVAYQQVGDVKAAATAYRKYQATRMATLFPVEGVAYLVHAKRYREGLDVIQKNEPFFARQDTISRLFQFKLNMKAQLFAGLGDYREALNQREQQLVVQDSINSRYNRDRIFEMTTLYKTREKDLQIKQNEAEMKVRNIQLFSVGGFAILLCVLLWFNYRHTRIVKRKNQSLAEKIDRQLDIADDLQAFRERNRFLATRLRILEAENGILSQETVAAAPDEGVLASEQAENKELFEELNFRLLNDKLFLDPNLSREDLTRLVNVNKNRFAQIIQENTGGNLKEYLNSLRTDYSIRLLREHPDHTLEAIAADSGFTNRGTFHSSFRKRTGMTPTEYKDTFR